MCQVRFCEIGRCISLYQSQVPFNAPQFWVASSGVHSWKEKFDVVFPNCFLLLQASPLRSSDLTGRTLSKISALLTFRSLSPHSSMLKFRLACAGCLLDASCSCTNERRPEKSRVCLLQSWSNTWSNSWGCHMMRITWNNCCCAADWVQYCLWQQAKTVQEFPDGAVCFKYTVLESIARSSGPVITADRRKFVWLEDSAWNLQSECYNTTEFHVNTSELAETSVNRGE
jgi:hypothetical protein